MKERPILFSGAMVQALLAGRKTQTRRVVKPGASQKWLTPKALADVRRWEHRKDGWWAMAVGEEGRIVHCGVEMDGGHIGCVRCPYGVPGDRLWVRETFGTLTGAGIRTVYRADGEEPAQAFYPHETIPDMKWRPSIFMPRWASRLTLEVTGVRVERLQDISDEDGRAEGYLSGMQFLCGDWAQPLREANPWVWVVSFKRLEDAKAVAHG